MTLDLKLKNSTRAIKGLLCITMALGTLLMAENAFGQSSNHLLRKGNKFYQGQNYTDAEANYKKALLRDSSSATGMFNLGNALYHQQRYKEAAERYASSIKDEKADKDEISSSNYNIGNTYMQGKEWQKAIDAYKKSLIANPKDDQARYNLAYAREMLKKKQGGGGKNNKDQKNKDQKQQNKDQKNKDQQNKNRKNQDKKDQNQNRPQDQKKDQKQKQPQPRPGEMDKQRADQLLNAAAQQEKKIQEKNDKDKKGVKVYRGKDW